MSAMERTTHTRSQDSNVWTFDEHRSNPPQADVSSDDSIPLSLSDLHGAPSFVSLSANRRTSRLGRICGLVVAAITILAAALNSDVISVPIGKTMVSIAGATKDQSPGPAASVNTSSLPPAEHAETIVSADHAALRNQVPAAHAQDEAAAPRKALDAETLAALTARAKSLLALGDIAAARLLLERAANAQDATAAFLLAQTYDPAVLGERDTRSITLNSEMALNWYRKAAGLGSAEAQQRLAQLRN